MDLEVGADVLIVSYGCTDYAAREAVMALREREIKVSHVSLLTLFPIQAEPLRQAAEGVRKVVIPEENLSGIYRKLLCGERLFQSLEVTGVGQIGALVFPEQIIAEVCA